MLGYFLGVKLCKFNVLHSPSSSQQYDRPHYSFRCNIESKHFTQIYSFKCITYPENEHNVKMKIQAIE